MLVFINIYKTKGHTNKMLHLLGMSVFGGGCIARKYISEWLLTKEKHVE